MTILGPELLPTIVAEANLAPSVHNTQPTRWQLNPLGTLRLFLDRKRLLKVGDPDNRDAAVSLGTALEGTRLALARHGLTLKGIEAAEVDGLPEVSADIAQSDHAVDHLSNMKKRVTWRGGFAAVSPETIGALTEFDASTNDAKAIVDPAEIEELASLNDTASLEFFRDRDYRAELLHWMRLSRNHPQWDRDGMSAAALAMSSLEAFGAGWVLRPGMFELCDRLHLAPLMVSEKARTLSSAGIVLFHRPVDENPVESGIAFYRVLLELTRIGLVAWPMAVIADAPDCRTEVARRFAIADDRRLINAFRVGALPGGALPQRTRLPPAELITTA